MDKDTQVYCTDCVYGDDVVNAMMFDNPDGNLPEPCKICWPFDIPDSRSFEIRKNFRARGGYVKDLDAKYFVFNLE